ncbi:MAG: hypothetical protein JW999_10725 [Methanotrichaceae archaeon]|nr:hypothetical protein [Methanotrichaceae archaeon]
MKKPMIITMLLIIIFTISPTQGQPLNDSSNETAFPAEAAVALCNESEAGSVPSLSYIWSLTGIESGPVTMVLHQDGSDLYGQAKYEPDNGQAWNAIVIGSVEGGRVYLVLTALKDTVQSSSRLTGTYDAASGLIRGDLLQVSNGSVSLRSEFQAMWINPDISSYTAARLALPRAEESALSQETNATLPEAKESLEPESSQKSRYYDVRQGADRILTGVGDISQIPIGMSGL